MAGILGSAPPQGRGILGGAYDIDDPASPLYRQRHGGSFVTGILDSLGSALTLPRRVYEGKVDLNTDKGTEEVLNLAGTAMSGGLVVGGPKGALGSGPIRAYHATYEPFDTYDFSRLGQITGENAAGSSAEDYAMNLARIGAWASDRPVSKEMAAPVTLPVEISGKAKIYQSLDELEEAVQNAGGPEEFREDLLSRGFGHVSVNDEEFGVNSFIGLGPEYFKILPQE